MQTAKPKRTQTPAEIYRSAQACLLALALWRAWALVQQVVEKTPEPVLIEIHRTGLTGLDRLPSRKQLAQACSRRIARNDQAAAGARSPSELERWPADALAMHAGRRRRKDTPGRATAIAADALTAACAAWKQFRRIDQQEAAAPSRMDELRKRKGA